MPSACKLSKGFSNFIAINLMLLIMIVSTTPSIEGRQIVEYLGIVTGETVIGANIFRDFIVVTYGVFTNVFL